MKNMKRALRRHHLRRREIVEIKKWLRSSRNEEHARNTAKVTKNNRTLCSCPMCGNPRKHWKRKTLQELKHETTWV